MLKKLLFSLAAVAMVAAVVPTMPGRVFASDETPTTAYCIPPNTATTGPSAIIQGNVVNAPPLVAALNHAEVCGGQLGDMFTEGPFYSPSFSHSGSALTFTIPANTWVALGQRVTTTATLETAPASSTSYWWLDCQPSSCATNSNIGTWEFTATNVQPDPYAVLEYTIVTSGSGITSVSNPSLTTFLFSGGGGSGSIVAGTCISVTPTATPTGAVVVAYDCATPGPTPTPFSQATPTGGNCIGVTTPPAAGAIAYTCATPTTEPSPQVTGTACAASPSVGAGGVISVPVGCATPGGGGGGNPCATPLTTPPPDVAVCTQPTTVAASPSPLMQQGDMALAGNWWVGGPNGNYCDNKSDPCMPSSPYPSPSSYVQFYNGGGACENGNYSAVGANGSVLVNFVKGQQLVVGCGGSSLGTWGLAFGSGGEHTGTEHDDLGTTGSIYAGGNSSSEEQGFIVTNIHGGYWFDSSSSTAGACGFVTEETNGADFMPFSTGACNLMVHGQTSGEFACWSSSTPDPGLASCTAPPTSGPQPSYSASPPVIVATPSGQVNVSCPLCMFKGGTQTWLQYMATRTDVTHIYPGNDASGCTTLSDQVATYSATAVPSADPLPTQTSAAAPPQCGAPSITRDNSTSVMFPGDASVGTSFFTIPAAVLPAASTNWSMCYVVKGPMSDGSSISTKTEAIALYMDDSASTNQYEYYSSGAFVLNYSGSNLSVMFTNADDSQNVCTTYSTASSGTLTVYINAVPVYTSTGVTMNGANGGYFGGSYAQAWPMLARMCCLVISNTTWNQSVINTIQTTLGI